MDNFWKQNTISYAETIYSMPWHSEDMVIGLENFHNIFFCILVMHMIAIRSVFEAIYIQKMTETDLEFNHIMN